MNPTVPTTTAKAMSPRRSRLAATMLKFALPELGIECVARMAGYCAEVVFPDKGILAEAIVRAQLMNLRYGFRASDIGRHVVLGGAERIMLEEGVSLHHGIVIQTGVEGYCRIGARTHISHGSVLAAGGGIDIGCDCALSSGLAIYSVTNTRPDARLLVDSPLRIAPVRIGDGVLIGANTMVQPGVAIADGAVLGAGAVVCTDVERDAVVTGIPARERRRLS
jgi:acetyltransferase-like isoleucine patch superfamily enzyme